VWNWPSVDVWQHSFATQLLTRASHGPARPIATIWLGKRHSDIQEDPVTAGGLVCSYKFRLGYFFP
jgi:hypothetical protein